MTSSMYASVGRYQVDGTAVEVSRRIEQGLIPILCRQPGFQSCSVLDGGDRALLTVLVFADKPAAETGASLAAAWIAEHLAPLTSLLEITTGEVTIYAGLWP